MKKYKQNKNSGLSTAFLVGCLVLILFSAFSQAIRAQEKSPQTKPRNVIFILSDDHRYDVMGFMDTPKFLETPALDSMADSTDYYTSKYLDVHWTPQFPFGWGLSYTTFSYAEPQLGAEKMTTDGSIQVAVRVSNTGSRSGAEVVQLYLQDVVRQRHPPGEAVARIRAR